MRHVPPTTTIILVHWLLLQGQVKGFQPTTPWTTVSHPNQIAAASRFSHRPTGALFMAEGDEDNGSTDNNNDTDDSAQSSRLPKWVSRWTGRGRRWSDNNNGEEMTTLASSVEESSNNNDLTVAATATLETDKEAAVEQKQTPKPKPEELTPAQRVEILKAQAERARLEAERMDAELTLQKIAKLERDLAKAKAKGADSVEELQREMAILQAKLTGETIPPAAPRSPPKEASASTTTSSPSSDDDTTTKALMSTTTVAADKPQSIAKPTPKGDFTSSLPRAIRPFDQKEFEEVLRDLENSPDFLKKLMTAQLGFDYDPATTNMTAVAVRLDEIRRYDFSFVEERPSFTQSEIDEMIERLKSNWFTNENAFVPDGTLKEAAGGNETELALMCLEYEFLSSKYEITQESANNFFDDEEVMVELADAIQQLSYDSITESFLPPCTRKEGQGPTLVQAQTFTSEILPKAKFTSTSKPIAVPGGYVVRGNSKAKNGDELIEAIDKQLERSSLKEKVTVCYLKDFTKFVDENPDDIDLENIGTVLFVGGPDLARESKKVQLSITTAFGIATCWYLSLYPFLLNSNIAKQVDEQLALADAGMQPDLTWLSDLSFPLFATFVGIQIFHEAGHRFTAALNDIKPTFPTFVPSIITGVTSVTTSFKEPPKNLQAMFDFSIAGPLLGMIGSIVAIAVGTQLSAGADPTNFPALPLEILRQSSLGGGIVESVLGSGILSIPDGARGTQAVASMVIPLHPVAVAGYISLVVNALSMLPIGTTDGGRVALALFGRQGKQAIGGLAMLAILLFGIQGSDLFLFYYAFCLAFQKGNEIPCRNEVETPDFSRVITATVAYFLALLALIPFQ